MTIDLMKVVDALEVHPVHSGYEWGGGFVYRDAVFLDDLKEAIAAYLSSTKSEKVAVKALEWEEAMALAMAAVHDGHGRGMIGQGRRHLEERVARALMRRDRDDLDAFTSSLQMVSPLDVKAKEQADG